MLKFFYTRKRTRKKFVDDLFTQVALAWMRWEEIHGAALSKSHSPTPQARFQVVVLCIGRLWWRLRMLVSHSTPLPALFRVGGSHLPGIAWL